MAFLPFLFLFLFLFLLSPTSAPLCLHASDLPPHRHSVGRRPSSSPALNASVLSSDSILVALLDSPYTELAELAEEASLLQDLEQRVGEGSITILAPRNAFLESVGAEFRRFVREPGNRESLRELLRFHVIPRRIRAAEWLGGGEGTGTGSARARAARTRMVGTMAGEAVELWRKGAELRAGLGKVEEEDAMERRDGVVHGIDRLLIPREVQRAYSEWKGGGGGGGRSSRMLAVLPEESPKPGTNRDSRRRKKEKEEEVEMAAGAGRAYSSPRSSSRRRYETGMASSPAPAPAPGPSTGSHFLHNAADSAVADFISTLLHYGGYNEFADLLVNLTSLAPDLSKLVSEGYRITLLAPSDSAFHALPVEHLAAPDLLLFLHIIPEYQTEESLYSAVRRFGSVSFPTLLRDPPLRLLARHEDGTVVFSAAQTPTSSESSESSESSSAHLVDIDIFTDGRISVQGIDNVLSPPPASAKKKKKKKKKKFRPWLSPSPRRKLADPPLHSRLPSPSVLLSDRTPRRRPGGGWLCSILRRSTWGCDR